jgi:hypothetical protein
MPGTICPTWKAICSVSAKKLSGFLFNVILPIFCTGTSSSGISLVGSRISKSNLCSSSSETICTPSSHSGRAPASMASHRSLLWKSGSFPDISYYRVNPKQWFPVKFHKAGFPCCIDEAESVYPKTLHHSVAAWNCPVRH